MADVFISYSHRDRRWKDRLLSQLGVLRKQYSLEVWEDSQIDAGEDWYEKIQLGLGSARIAILLVSADYLDSDFILEEEIPRLLERRRSEGLRVIPVIVRPCAWEQVSWLRQMQVELRNGRPLCCGNVSQIEQHFANLAAKLMEYLHRDIMSNPHGGNKRILIVDDHSIVRHGLSRSIQQEDDMEVVGQAGDGRTAVEMAKELMPSIVLMDITLPELNGIEATREIVRASPGTLVIALSMHSAKRYVREMFRAGASGYLMKDCDFEELARAIRSVADGQTYISPSVGQTVVEDYVRGTAEDEERTPFPLTQREQQVLRLIVRGRTARQIALRLHMGPKTLERHRLYILNKLREESAFSSLTRREREVLQLLAKGRTARQMALRLHTSLKTLERHRLRIVKRLDEESVLSALTQREREVLQLMTEGNSAKQIALRLFISPKTVAAHQLRIMNKLDIDNVAQLTKYAIQEELFPPES